MKRRLGIRKGMKEVKRGNRLYVAHSFGTQTKQVVRSLYRTCHIGRQEFYIKEVYTPLAV
jgi:hypothetical protein